jgi:predicted NBD/HSP70 family sugar kinase
VAGIRRCHIVAIAIEELLGIPCWVANDANMIIAEGLIGIDRARFCGTAAVAFIGYGVGMGLIINGEVYQGPTGATAELGPMNHLPDGPLWPARLRRGLCCGL